jgi:formiminotetrahydrofolate cyclodeaminase
MRRASILVLVGVVLLSVTSSVSAQSKTREQLIEEIKEKRSELSVLEKQVLDVADSDRTATRFF